MVARSARRADVGARRATAVSALGLIAAAVGGLHVVNSAGGFGTGNGLAGAVYRGPSACVEAVGAGRCATSTRRS